jgi:hypothetical protein
MKPSSIYAGAMYFGIVFAAGFVFGTARALLTADAPEMRLAAVAVELPLILAVSWFACRHAIRLFAVPAFVSVRAAVGAIAFAMLMVAEAAISIGLAGRSLSEHLALYAEASHLLGLVGQVVFAVLPVLQIRWR